MFKKNTSLKSTNDTDFSHIELNDLIDLSKELTS